MSALQQAPSCVRSSGAWTTTSQGQSQSLSITLVEVAQLSTRFHALGWLDTSQSVQPVPLACFPDTLAAHLMLSPTAANPAPVSTDPVSAAPSYIQTLQNQIPASSVQQILQIPQPTWFISARPASHIDLCLRELSCKVYQSDKGLLLLLC